LGDVLARGVKKGWDAGAGGEQAEIATRLTDTVRTRAGEQTTQPVTPSLV
jgi:hypothetical protein